MCSISVVLKCIWCIVVSNFRSSKFIGSLYLCSCSPLGQSSTSGWDEERGSKGACTGKATKRCTGASKVSHLFTCILQVVLPIQDSRSSSYSVWVLGTYIFLTFLCSFSREERGDPRETPRETPKATPRAGRRSTEEEDDARAAAAGASAALTLLLIPALKEVRNYLLQIAAASHLYSIHLVFECTCRL